MPEKGLHEKNDLSFKRVTLSASQKGHVRRIASYPPNTVDGKNSAPVEVGSLAHYVSGFYTSQVGKLAGFLPPTNTTLNLDERISQSP